MGGYGRANRVIGLFEKVSHMAQKHHAGMQETCWDKANKGLASFKYGTLSKYFFSVLTWNFCTTWLQSCKGPIRSKPLSNLC